MEKMTLNQFWRKSNKRFTTVSDIGGLRVGNADFSINIPNGMGDGETRVAFYDSHIPQKDIKCDDYFGEGLRYFTCLKGTFNIYGYDCSKGDEDYLATFTGRFGIYYCSGYIFFERWLG